MTKPPLWVRKIHAPVERAASIFLPHFSRRLRDALDRNSRAGVWQRLLGVGAGPTTFRRIVVAIDPAGSSNKNSDETGIIVAGQDPTGIGWVLADLSGKYSPDTWARKAVEAYKGWRADRIVAEKNYGGDMVESTIKAVDPLVPARMVTATRGKQLRAEPISSIYEQGRVRHLGNLSQLEDQLCEWNPAENGPSPDRLDALVWALTDLMTTPPPMRISQEALAAASRPGPATRRGIFGLRY